MPIDLLSVAADPREPAIGWLLNHLILAASNRGYQQALGDQVPDEDKITESAIEKIERQILARFAALLPAGGAPREFEGSMEQAMEAAVAAEYGREFAQLKAAIETYQHEIDALRDVQSKLAFQRRYLELLAEAIRLEGGTCELPPMHPTRPDKVKR